MTTATLELGVDELRRRAGLKWDRFGPDVLPAWVAEMDFTVAPAVRQAIVDAVAAEAFGYAADPLVERLRAACAGWQRRYGWEVDAGDVHVVPDAVRGVEVAIDAYSPPGSPVVLPTPAYTAFFDVLAVSRRPVVEVPANRELDLDAVDRAFAGGARCLILCNPHNPLGRVFSADELRALAELVGSHGGRVVADEVHAPLTYPGHFHVPYPTVSEVAAGHSVVVTSASKAWNLAGLKCAQVITANDADRRTWGALPKLRTWGASTIGIVANTAAFELGAPWLDELRAALDANRHLLGSTLPGECRGLRFRPPEGTYFAWLDFREAGWPCEPADFLLDRAGVALSPGLAFGAVGVGHARLNFATSAAILTEVAQAIATAAPTATGRPRRAG